LELQHLAPQVIERINASFGFPVLKALSITQGPAARPGRAAGPARPLDPETESELEMVLQPVADAPLRQSLTRLGRAVLGAGKA
jgi:hypothetical protein